MFFFEKKEHCSISVTQSQSEIGAFPTDVSSVFLEDMTEN
jgi:hypothetical protein